MKIKEDLPDPPVINILLLGDANVGKTTFLSRITQPPSSTTKPELLKDINQPFVFSITFSQNPYTFEFYDTASPTNWSLCNPHVVILCYDISQRLSLINLQRIWSKEVTRCFAEDFVELPVMVLGLKRDLRSEQDPNGIIYPQEGNKVASELRADGYMECSAQTGELVREVFEDICKRGVNSIKGTGLSEGGCGLM